jgi:hypothetical protein
MSEGPVGTPVGSASATDIDAFVVVETGHARPFTVTVPKPSGSERIVWPQAAEREREGTSGSRRGWRGGGYGWGGRGEGG